MKSFLLSSKHIENKILLNYYHFHNTVQQFSLYLVAANVTAKYSKNSGTSGWIN